MNKKGHKQMTLKLPFTWKALEIVALIVEVQEGQSVLLFFL